MLKTVPGSGKLAIDVRVVGALFLLYISGKAVLREDS